jgi:2-polyprenyl-3-methyl-5-hydroxy-6-metoxy-1,4-benzoquinol methylase
MGDAKRRWGGLSVLPSLVGVLFPRLVSRANWDREYKSGGWERLRSQDELVRYDAIVDLMRGLPKDSAVLDVGAGSGRLLELLHGVGFGSYLGIDLSAEALKQAAKLGVANASFVESDAESFTTEQKFDAIIFNEVAYYLKRPADVLARYEQYLRPGGMLIVSMFSCTPARWTWRQLDRSFDYVEAKRVQNARKLVWDVKVVRAPVPRTARMFGLFSDALSALPAARRSERRTALSR